jgi:hypothetical protein
MRNDKPFTEDDLKRGEQIVMELHGLSGFAAWSEHIAKTIAALRSSHVVAAEAREDWSCVADFLDDIEVDDKGMCRWSDVANAETHIRHSMRAVLRAALVPPATGAVREALIAAKCTSSDDGTYVHASMREVLAAIMTAYQRPEGRMSESDATREALFMCASSCQGSYSAGSMAASKALGVPFPITLDDLIKKATEEGRDPRQLWSWLMRHR